jgi:hypothetical protein
MISFGISDRRQILGHALIQRHRDLAERRLERRQEWSVFLLAAEYEGVRWLFLPGHNELEKKNLTSNQHSKYGQFDSRRKPPTIPGTINNRWRDRLLSVDYQVSS